MPRLKEGRLNEIGGLYRKFYEPPDWFERELFVTPAEWISSGSPIGRCRHAFMMRTSR